MVIAALSHAMVATAQPVQVETSARFSFRGHASLEISRPAVAAFGWDVVARSDESEGPISTATGPVETAAIEFADDRAGGGDVVRAEIIVPAGLMLVGADDRVSLVGFTLRFGAAGDWSVQEPATGATILELSSVLLDARPASGEFRLVGEVVPGDELVGRGFSADTVLGRLMIDGRIERQEGGEFAVQADEGLAPVIKRTAGTIGPDVIVGDLHEVATFGTSGAITAFSVGTTSCNIGDAPLQWFSNTNKHPVIAQNMYRLKGGRFEQIGLSWLKHGFFALSENRCFSDCQPTNGTYLGVHCSDPYSAWLNGQQSNLGPRYQVNASTGLFFYPPANPAYSGILPRRIQVANADLDPAQNAGAIYFVEGHYVTPDDAAAGNKDNNASFRPVTVTPNGSSYSLTLTGSTRRQKAGIRAWRETDPLVSEVDVQVPNDGLFIIAAKATDLGGGVWNYEYAVQNLNSHRSARAFTVPIDPAAVVQSTGFHDVNYHSGEPFSGTNWSSSVSNGEVTWTTEDITVDSNANALRWGTVYNFRFVIDRQPHTSSVRIDLFREGTPASVSAAIVGPITSEADCNENGVPDSIDIQNGFSPDCDGDVVPDECESFPVTAILVAEGLDRPVYATAPPGPDDRLFIVEQSGRIRILDGANVLAAPFLDIAGMVSSSGERGLLSMAFDPAYAANGFFYVNYTDLSGDTVVARYQCSADPNAADPSSAQLVINIAQDLATHNGGQLQFGPDGYLYIGMGHGGGAFDAFNWAQDPGSLLGKILRLDARFPPYAIPESNPFAGSGLPLDEIWAMGVRNPWRFSFDRASGDLYVADVGQDARDEVNYQPAAAAGGANYGWRCMEGSTCTGLSGCTCDALSLTLPVFEYPHTGADCSITGGYVYRGCAIPNLQGAYLYADYCSGRIGSLRVEDGVATDLQDLTDAIVSQAGDITTIASFGENADGELFIVSRDGKIYRIVPDPLGGAVCGNGVIEPGEVCDDSNALPGDGCDENCLAETGPSNDRCLVPAAITEGVFMFDNAGAGTDGPADSETCAGSADALGSDLWYCYTPARSGSVEVSLCDSGFNTIVAVYEGCACPSEPPIACNNNACGEFGNKSFVSFAGEACGSYLIRVGGFLGEQGPGVLEIVNMSPAIAFDCDGNGVEDADDILCGSQHDSNGNQIPDTCETDGDYIRGGRLYDAWWIEAALPEPTVGHPLWSYRPDPVSNQSTGSATWRCKECHGWDYKGVDGQYGSGPHRTGFPGALGTTLSAVDLVSLLKEPPSNGGGPGIPNGHDYASVLPDTRINDLVAFLLVGAIDDNPHIDPATGEFNGDPLGGEANYTSGPAPACMTCHGPQGTNINFGTKSDPEYVGTIAVENPWELLHKVRFGQPGAPMPSWLASGGTTLGAVDIGRYVQLNFPTDCTNNSHCDDLIPCTEDLCDPAGRCAHTPDDSQCSDDGVFCSGRELCDMLAGCSSAGNPCTDPGVCQESPPSCGCLPPVVSAAGCRYLAISPQPGDGSMAMAILVSAVCPLSSPKYVGTPFGPYNVALLVDDAAQAAYLTPAQWGGTVYVTGVEIAPELTYTAQADCGVPGQPVLTEISEATTPVWADFTGIPERDGVANVLDVSAVVDGVKGLPSALPLYALDVVGCVPNQRLDVIDIASTVDAVKGFTYRLGTSCPGPCW